MEIVKIGNSIYKSATIYEYDILRRIENIFYPSLRSPEVELLIHYTFDNNEKYPRYWEKEFYWTQVPEKNKKDSKYLYKNGKTYYLRDYHKEGGNNIQYPDFITFYGKDNENDSIQIYGPYASQSEIKYDDSTTQIFIKRIPLEDCKYQRIIQLPNGRAEFIYENGNEEILFTRIENFKNGQLKEILQRDFQGFPWLNRTIYNYNENGLLIEEKRNTTYFQGNMKQENDYNYSYEYF